jgi:hypothetical protein
VRSVLTAVHSLTGELEAVYFGLAFPTLLRGEPNDHLGWVAVPAAVQVALFIGARSSRSHS